MKVKVITDFWYAADGRDPKKLRAGRSYDIHADHVGRFVEEGKIEGVAAPVKPKRARRKK